MDLIIIVEEVRKNVQANAIILSLNILCQPLTCILIGSVLIRNMLNPSACEVAKRCNPKSLLTVINPPENLLLALLINEKPSPEFIVYGPIVFLFEK